MDHEDNDRIWKATLLIGLACLALLSSSSVVSSRSLPPSTAPLVEVTRCHAHSFSYIGDFTLKLIEDQLWAFVDGASVIARMWSIDKEGVISVHAGASPG